MSSGVPSLMSHLKNLKWDFGGFAAVFTEQTLLKGVPKQSGSHHRSDMQMLLSKLNYMNSGYYKTCAFVFRVFSFNIKGESLDDNADQATRLCEISHSRGAAETRKCLNKIRKS